MLVHTPHFLKLFATFLLADKTLASAVRSGAYRARSVSSADAVRAVRAPARWRCGPPPGCALAVPWPCGPLAAPRCAAARCRGLGRNGPLRAPAGPAQRESRTASRVVVVQCHYIGAMLGPLRFCEVSFLRGKERFSVVWRYLSPVKCSKARPMVIIMLTPFIFIRFIESFILALVHFFNFYFLFF